MKYTIFITDGKRAIVEGDKPLCINDDFIVIGDNWFRIDKVDHIINNKNKILVRREDI